MSNRAARSKEKGNITTGQTNKHFRAVEEKLLMLGNHLGKYATARDISARMVARKAAIIAKKEN